MSETLGWARAWATARPLTNPRLRQGAWYPVVGAETTRVVLEVHGRRVAVPHQFVEIRSHRPERFTVVYRSSAEPNPADGTPADLGRTYVVCPSSGSRLRLIGHPKEIECPTCGHRGEIAWWETG